MRRLLFLAALGIVACSNEGRSPGPAGAFAPAPTLPEHQPLPEPTPLTYPQPCHAIYAQDALPEMRVDMTPETLAAMREERRNGIENWHPATFRFEDDAVAVMVRNRGNNYTFTYCADKLQIAIDFNRENPDARWRGLRRITLDSGHCRIFDERLSLSFAHDAGLPAPCANHAKLYLNGAYEGLFTNVEHVDKTFLTRNFGPDGNDGNLWYDGWERKTNEDEPTSDHSNRRWREAGTLDKIDALADIDQAIREWALEAIVPATDNFWVDGWNYWLYEHPERGFLYIPRDFDKATPWSTKWITFDPLVLDSAQHPVRIVLADPVHHARYREELEAMLEIYDPDIAERRVEEWWAQVGSAAADDPYLDVSPGAPPPRHLIDAIHARHDWLRDRLMDAP